MVTVVRKGILSGKGLTGSSALVDSFSIYSFMCHSMGLEFVYRALSITPFPSSVKELLPSLPGPTHKAWMQPAGEARIPTRFPLLAGVLESTPLPPVWGSMQMDVSPGETRFCGHKAGFQGQLALESGGTRQSRAWRVKRKPTA